MIRLLLLCVGIALGAALTLWLERAPPGERELAAVPGTAGDDVAHGAPDDDDDDDEEAPSRVRQVDGVLEVLLSPAEVTAAGIVSAPFAPTTVQREIRSVGRVADAAGLLAAQRELAAARAAAAAQQEVVSVLAERRARLRDFAASGEITVTRELADLELEFRRARELAVDRAARVAAARTTLHATWGRALATLAEQTPARLAPLETGSRRLIEFTARGAPPPIVYAATDEVRAGAVEVEVLGPAAGVLGAAQAASFVGLAPAEGLRMGMRLEVFIPASDAPVDGLLLPRDAVVWQRGEAWYFELAGAGRYLCRALGDALPHPDGWVLVDAGQAGNEVVVRGAQALLAEAYRTRIPDEDDD